jgi:uncharacterized membrane protein
MYNRDGTPRAAWYDPLGFAGLDQVPPPPQMQSMLAENYAKFSQRQAELEGLVPKKAAELQAMGARLKSMEGNPHLAKQHAALELEISTFSAEVHLLRREYWENTSLMEGLTRQLERMKAGGQDDPRLHIHHLAVPDDPTRVLRFDRLAETWAAVSMSLLMFAIAALIFLTPQYLWTGLVIILILFVVTESFLRGAFVQTVGRITLILAMVAALILFLHFWKWILVAALVAMGISLMYQRLRELTG